MQTNTPEIFRKETQAQKEKNAGYHTYQLKIEKSYKIMIKELFPRTYTKNIGEELTKMGYHVRAIKNITKYDTDNCYCS